MANASQVIGGMGSGAAAGAAFGPIGAGVGAGVGGLVGLLSGSGDEDFQKQQDIINQQIANLQGIGLPSIEAQQIVLEKYREAGQLTPEMEAAITQGPSRMEQVKVDPRLKQAQMAALTKLQQVGEEGFSPVEKAQLNQVNRQIAQQEKAREGSILQNMAARGVGGSGAELAAQLSSSQAAANTASEQSDAIKAQAYQNALNAISQGGNLAGSMGQQEFSQQSQVAQAADAIARANAANQQGVETRNVGSKNTAQASNLANKQNIMNLNTGVGNQQEMYNKQLPMQQYYAQLAKAQGQNAALGNMGNFYGQQGTRANQEAGNLMSGFGQIAGSAGQVYKGMNTPGPAKYNNQTGKTLYNPETGQSYADEDFDNYLKSQGAKKVG